MSGPSLTDDLAGEIRTRYRAYAQKFIAPKAAEADRCGRLDPEVVDALRCEGFLGAPMAQEYGGLGMDMVSYGLLNAEIGRTCSSCRTLLTVHNLVGLTLQRWGNPFIRREVLPDLSAGRKVAAIAMSESPAGSDISSMRTMLSSNGATLRLEGQKAWTSFGLLADWFLVFAQSEDGPVAVLIPADSPGLARQPMTAVTGIRGNMLAELTFQNCPVEPQQIVGKPGFGFSHISTCALDHGRYSVAWGAVGVAEACLSETVRYLSERQQFGGRMIDLPLARASLSQMMVKSRAARQLCMAAGRLRAAKSPDALLETMVAKYFAAGAAAWIANAAVRLHGARGLSCDYAVERFLRDAKAMEIIEGGEEVLELLIAAQLTSEVLGD